MRTVSVVRRNEYPDYYLYTIADERHRKHTVEIPAAVLQIEPKEFHRGNDTEHLDIIACGAVLLSIDDEAIFHKVDRSMVDRAYHAASGAQILGQFGM
jgi:hypothetical protein